MLMISGHGKRLARGTRSGGFSMLETLVTLFIISIWLLGSAGVQTAAMKLNKTSQFRNTAILLATEMGERIETNKKGARAKSYVYDGTTTPTLGTDCLTSSCNSIALAAFDIYEWYTRANAALSGVTLSIASSDAANANPITYAIVVSWSERRNAQTYSTTGTTETVSYTASKTVYE
jgi:type IV pilus assembly protein PilV